MTVLHIGARRFFLVICRKKNMRRISFLLMILASTASCTRLYEIKDSSDKEDIWTGPGASIDNPEGFVCYITGFDYPEGHDWKSEEGIENARCSLTVFADAVPMLKLAVGSGHEVSPDPDMHKVIDGHLYTFFCKDGMTSVRKDGKSFIRYAGNEKIRHILLKDNDLYTLGIPEDGNGFIYRKNGEILMERRNGCIFERLHEDDERVCFAFSQPVTTSDGQSTRYYMVRNDRLSLVDTGQAEKVWDLISCQGRNYILASSGPWNTVDLTADGKKSTVTLPHGAEMVSCHMFLSGTTVCIEGLYSSEDNSLSSGIWVGSQEYMMFETGQTISAACASDKEICCILNPDSDNTSGLIFRNGKTIQMPSGYSCQGNTPLAIHNGDLYIALTSLSGSRPLLWKNGETASLKLNGPLCNIAICPAS